MYLEDFQQIGLWYCLLRENDVFYQQIIYKTHSRCDLTPYYKKGK